MNDSTHDTATDNRGSKKAKTKMGSATIAGFGPGLSERIVKESRAHHGSNLLTPPQRTPWWRQLLRKFDDPIIRILIIAAVVAIAVGMVDGSYVEGIGIVIAILLATVLAFVNEYKAEREFDLLNKSSDDNPVTVLRDGNYTTVPRKDIVVGDLVLVEMGEEIPADGDLLQALSLSINESRLTGESEPVFKYPKDELLEKDEEPAYPFHRLLRGTTVMDGHGLVKITHVGDSSEIGRTARAAAEEHLTGPEFSTEDEDTLRGKVCPLKIVSRAKPEDKLRLVKLLKEKRQVVAVTGDGTNDAPALNLADVGLAMGRTGTAVAKEASDIILLDDSFPSIVQAVKWGRSLYKNIQRFIVFQLTINLAALGIALLGPFLGIKLPLTVPQMLWVNLIMDTFAALALATEPPHDEVMLDPPRDPDELILTPAMNRFIIGTGATFLVCFIGLILYLRTHTVTPYALSVFFTLFVLAQFWNLFNARCFGLNQSAFTGILENKGFLLIAAFILFGQILIVQFGGRVFRTVPLSFRDWIFIILGTSSVLWVGEAFRFVKKRTSSSPLSRTAPT